MGRQGIGDVLVLSGGGASDELGELGVGRVLQNEGRKRGGADTEVLSPADFRLELGIGQGARSAVARLGIDRPGQDVTDLGAGSAPDGGLKPLGGRGELEDPAGRARALELLGDDGDLLSTGTQSHDLWVAAAVGLVGPHGTDRDRGEQEEAGGDGEGRPEPTRTTGRHGRHSGYRVTVLAALGRQCPATMGRTSADPAPDGLTGGQGRGEEAAQRQGGPGPGPSVDGSQSGPGDVTALTGGHTRRESRQHQAAEGQEDTGAGRPEAPGDEQADDPQDRNQEEQNPGHCAQNASGHECVDWHRRAGQQIEAARRRHGDG